MDLKTVSLKSYDLLFDSFCEDCENKAFKHFIIDRGFQIIESDKDTTCYSTDKVLDKGDMYVVPVVLAKAMVQNYPQRNQVMAKLPRNLKQAILIDYATGDLIENLPLFEFHPKKEKKKLEVGYVSDIVYQEDKFRLVGVAHIFKDKITTNLRKFLKMNKQIGVSVGFAYTEGPKGIYEKKKYDVAQENIMITHLALLPPNRAMGRCPLPLCGTGIDDIDDDIDLQSVKQMTAYTKKINMFFRDLKRVTLLLFRAIPS